MMNKTEFIDELRRELKKLPLEEQQDAIQYYEEYFAEAGKENEARIIEELGSPRRVAAGIKSEYAAKLLEDGDGAPAGKRLSAVWWVIIGICSAPLSIPMVIVAFAIVLAMAIVVLSIIISAVACVISFAASSVIIFGAGVVAMFHAASTAMLFIGTGLAGMALMAAAGVGIIAGIKELTKAMIRAAKSVNSKNKEKKLIRELTQGEWKYVQTPEESEAAYKKEGER